MTALCFSNFKTENKFQHVTIGVSGGFQPKYSNELLESCESLKWFKYCKDNKISESFVEYLDNLIIVGKSEEVFLVALDETLEVEGFEMKFY